MDSTIAAALVAGGWATITALGTQVLTARREATRERSEAQRDERNRRSETNRERLIELRALLDASAVTLIGCEKAVDDLRAAISAEHSDQIEVPAATLERVAALEHELDQLEGRLALRLGATHETTRAFMRASHALSEASFRLWAVRNVKSDPGRGSGTSAADTLDKAQGNAFHRRQEFFERALKLVGVEGPLQDTSGEHDRND